MQVKITFFSVLKKIHFIKILFYFIFVSFEICPILRHLCSVPKIIQLKHSVSTLQEHQMVLTIAIFQKFLISMEVYEISIFNYLNDAAQFRGDVKEIYI